MKLLFIGAHPDDPDYFAGGTAVKFARAGHQVKFVSVTNGDAGHATERGPDLAERRRREAWAAGNIGGLEYQVMNNHDGQLQPTLQARNDLIALIRAFNPDALFTHRPNDYHPDHRITSQLVQDASYLLTVPSIVPREAHLARMPVILYTEDRFMKPNPFEADVCLSIDEAIEDKIRMLDCHESQFYEWLPFNQGEAEKVPLGKSERIAWLGEAVKRRAEETAARFRTVLKVLYGDAAGTAVKYAEAFEACEYGAPLTAENRKALFPFFPA